MYKLEYKFRFRGLWRKFHDTNLAVGLVVTGFDEESIDFLDKLGAPLEKLRIPSEPDLKPCVLTFNHRRLVNATYNGYCLCPEGLTDLLYDLNPEFIYNAKLD